MSFAQMLQERAATIPEDGAFGFLHGGEEELERVTFAGLHRDARALAEALAGCVEPGARVLLLLPPGLDYARAVYGCFQAAVVGVSAPPPHPKRLERTLSRLLRIAADAEVGAILTHAAIRDGAAALRAEHPELGRATWIALEEALDGSPAPAEAPVPALEELAFLQYTSGSTREPRGVMLTHGNLLDNSSFITRAFGITAETRGLNWLPPYHDMGLIGGILQPVFVGGTSILMSPLAVVKRPAAWLEGISRHRATVSGGPNFAYDLCLRRVGEEVREQLDLSSWEVAFDGAEPIRAETIQRFGDSFAPCGFRRTAFYPCYGLAEATLMVTGPPLGAQTRTLSVDAEALAAARIEPPRGGAGEAVLVGCGRPDSAHEVAIVDPGSGRRCAPGEVGEIWVAGPSVAAGYWRSPAETAAAFGARLAGEAGERDFLRSGDLGFVDGEDLFVVGRLKELIILNGRNLHPHDIEASAEAAHDLIRPHCSAAFSVEAGGAEGVGLVLEVEDSEPATAATVIGEVRRRVAAELDVQLHRVALCPRGAVPKTTSGKIQRLLCREMIARGELEPLQLWNLA